MQTITRNNDKYMSLFHTHEMFSYAAGCRNTTYSDLISEGVIAMKAFEAQENLVNFEKMAAIQYEQKFFVQNFELCLKEHDIEILDDEDDELDMDFDDF